MKIPLQVPAFHSPSFPPPLQHLLAVVLVGGSPPKKFLLKIVLPKMYLKEPLWLQTAMRC